MNWNYPEMILGMLLYMLNLYFSQVTNTRGTYLHKQVWFVSCPLLTGIEKQIKPFFKACLQSHTV